MDQLQLHRMTVETEEAGQRIDKWLSDQMEDVSRSQIQQWIKEGRVKIAESVIKSNYKVADQDEVVVSIPAPVEMNIQAEAIPLNIVFEDEDVVVINKPRGLVVHPAPGHYSGTLVNGLLAHCKDLSGINGVLRPGIVHRIDKDTSGLIMVAKNDKAHVSLAKQLKDHTVTRKYVGLVHGNISHDQGTVDAPVGRDPHDRQAMTVTAKNSKPAVTHFVVLQRLGNYTLVEYKLETGRTHQIRVHMKFIGHPLVGDPKYGHTDSVPIEGQALHAQVLGFVHPSTQKYIEFETHIPEDMKQLMDWISKRTD
jgi:23S rRNA pseudouridine1911/1915/1917 synthase